MSIELKKNIRKRKMEEWQSRYFGEPITPIPDCNDCCWLNLTEDEQDMRGIKYISHRCAYYDVRVLHKASLKVHDNYIYPCDRCAHDGYKNFSFKKEEGKWKLMY